MASTTVELEHVLKVWATMRPNSPIYNFLLSSADIISASKGAVTARLTLSENHVNSRGTIHGAVTATLVDWSGGLSIASYTLGEKTGASVDIHVTYIGTAMVGETIEIEAKANKVGRSMAFTTIRISKFVEGKENAMVATASHFNEATSSTTGASGSVPDDLALSCGCHFHWQCLLDESPQVAISLSCPSCNNSIVSTGAGPSATNNILPAQSQPQVLTWYHNEGGIQENLDILPLITEEAYLDANPAARPARAFMTMCGEGDVGGIIELLRAIEEDRDDEDMSPAELLRFQDPLDSNKTGLHAAIEKSQQETVWLLLWLASGLPTDVFPIEVSRAAEVTGAGRGTAQGPDIRGLRDEQGRTAGDVAGSMGSTWVSLLSTGILKE